MKSLATLNKEYQAARKDVIKAIRRADRLQAQIQKRMLANIPFLEDVKIANAAERAKFGALLHTGMKVKFIVEDLTKQGVLTTIKSDSFTVVEEQTGKKFSVTKNDLLPA
jgi:hypothetical protein